MLLSENLEVYKLPMEDFTIKKTNSFAGMPELLYLKQNQLIKKH